MIKNTKNWSRYIFSNRYFDRSECLKDPDLQFQGSTRSVLGKLFGHNFMMFCWGVVWSWFITLFHFLGDILTHFPVRGTLKQFCLSAKTEGAWVRHIWPWSELSELSELAFVWLIDLRTEFTSLNYFGSMLSFHREPVIATWSCANQFDRTHLMIQHGPWLCTFWFPLGSFVWLTL